MEATPFPPWMHELLKDVMPLCGFSEEDRKVSFNEQGALCFFFPVFSRHQWLLSQRSCAEVVWSFQHVKSQELLICENDLQKQQSIFIPWLTIEYLFDLGFPSTQLQVIVFGSRRTGRMPAM